GILVRVRRSWHDCVRLAETEELPRIIYGLSFVRIAQAGGQRDALGQGASHLPEAGRRAGLDVRFQNVSELLSRQANGRRLSISLVKEKETANPRHGLLVPRQRELF